MPASTRAIGIAPLARRRPDCAFAANRKSREGQEDLPIIATARRPSAAEGKMPKSGRRSGRPGATSPTIDFKMV